MEPPTTIITPPSWTRELPLETLFDPARPLEVDVGCGKGRFLLARAAAHPEVNFLGIERLLRRLRKIDRKAVRRGIGNVRLLRIEASYGIQFMLPPLSVRAFYVFFPDPWPKKRHHRRRLFTAEFMDSLDRALLPGGLLHVATDHQDYFEEIQALLGSDARFEQTSTFVPLEEERTDFEVIFLTQEQPIGRCSFRRKEDEAAAGQRQPTP